MPIDHEQMPNPEACGFAVTENDSELHVTLRKDFESKRGADRWAFPLVAACTGPYSLITVDCSGFVTLSSSAIAGLMHIADELSGDKTVVLKNASERVQRTLKMMHLDSLLRVE